MRKQNFLMTKERVYFKTQDFFYHKFKLHVTLLTWAKCYALHILTALGMFCVRGYISDYEITLVLAKFMFTVDEKKKKSLKGNICWNLHSVLENICLTTECSHILTFKLPHWERINVLQQFSLRGIVLGFHIQKNRLFFLGLFCDKCTVSTQKH